MAQAQKQLAWVGWGQESTFGTPVTATKFIEIESESIKEEQKYIFKPFLRFNSQARKVKGKQNVTGSFVTPVLWTGHEQLLKHALGTVATTGSGPYTHTFTPGATLPTGLTLNVNRDADALTGSTCFRYAGCQISKLTLRQNVEEHLMMECEILGAVRAQIAKPSPSFPTFDQIDYTHVTVKAINPASANVDLPIRNVEIVIDNDLFADGYRLGSAQRAMISRAGQRKVTFSFEAEFNSNTVYAYWLGLTETDLKFTWYKDANTEMVVTLPKVVFDGEDPASDGPGPYYLNLSGTAFLNSADNDELSIALKNATSSVG